MRYEFTLTGETPILMHADDVMSADAMELWRSDPKNKAISKRGDDRSPAWTWIGYLYHAGGNVVLPCENLQKCLSQAGAKLTLKGKKTFKEAAVSGIWIEQATPALLVKGKPVSMAKIDGLRTERDFAAHMETSKKLGFDLDVRRAKIGMSKHIRVRPKFDSWSVVGVIDVDDGVKELTKDVVTEIFHYAGKVGLGDWRPGCGTPGRWGMFRSELKTIKE